MSIRARIGLKNLFIGASWIFFSFGEVLLTVAGRLLSLKTKKNRYRSLLLLLSWIDLLIMESADDAESDPPTQG